MKHLKTGKKLHRKQGPRKALIKSLEVNLIMYEKIKTTQAKAKETQRQLEKLITIAKKQDLTALRRLAAALPAKASRKLYSELAPRYRTRKGGYTRIIKLTQGIRSDDSSMVILELVK
ncbi:MAG: 50S ribosomal protein L17 [Parcubacteria group bacterium ADurb.Bin305]|jgi:large subunit ribosomal protein L17|nr:50S ribosomal protein L17 [Candidatus Paceibacterota bacterium]MDD3434441.1 50S ribosomal protein L17 [Candidatus Paceibacterota bacterium]OQA44263.1 MAG: 50S ribosomal protein L17 [Parcubacteria group bacterium ADurb.Bin305]